MQCLHVFCLNPTCQQQYEKSVTKCVAATGFTTEDNNNIKWLMQWKTCSRCILTEDDILMVKENRLFTRHLCSNHIK